MDDYLTKPFRREALSAMLARWLPGCMRARVAAEIPAEVAPARVGTALDARALEAIRSLGGTQTPDLLEQIVRLYFESATQLMSAIRAGLAAADNDQIRVAAHTLKSSSANLGAHALAELCKKLELAARANAVSRDAPAWSEVEAEYERVRAALQQEVGVAA